MSGSQIGGVVGGAIGGVIGFAFGNPVAGLRYGYAIGSVVGGYVDPARSYGPRLEDVSAQTSTVGGIIPFGYGVFTCAGNIIWADRLIEHKKTQRVGKGGGQKETTYTYTRSYAIGVSETISSYVWIKKNGKLIYAADPVGLGTAMGWSSEQIADLVAASNDFLRMATLYYGTSDQMPDSTIVAVEGVGNVSPFRDLAYIVLENEDLTDTQGAVAQYEFCVQADGVVYATSPPYPVLVEEGVRTESLSLAPITVAPPLDKIDVSSFALDGVHRELVVYYPMGPEEVTLTSHALDGEHFVYDPVREYKNYGPEAVGASSSALDGTHKIVMIVYQNYRPEAVSTTSHALDGVHKSL